MKTTAHSVLGQALFPITEHPSPRISGNLKIMKSKAMKLDMKSSNTQGLHCLVGDHEHESHDSSLSILL